MASYNLCAHAWKVSGAQGESTGGDALKAELVCAYLRLGEAFAANKGHEDRDASRAAQVCRCLA